MQNTCTIVYKTDTDRLRLQTACLFFRYICRIFKLADRSFYICPANFLFVGICLLPYLSLDFVWLNYVQKCRKAISSMQIKVLIEKVIFFYQICSIFFFSTLISIVFLSEAVNACFPVNSIIVAAFLLKK